MQTVIEALQLFAQIMLIGGVAFFVVILQAVYWVSIVQYVRGKIFTPRLTWLPIVVIYSLMYICSMGIVICVVGSAFVG